MRGAPFEPPNFEAPNYEPALKVSWDSTNLVKFDTIVNDGASQLNSLCWSTDGSQLMASAEDDSVLLTSLDIGLKTWTSKGLFSRKHGAEQSKFLGNSNSVALALSKFNRDVVSTVRIWDLRENRFLKVISFDAKILRCNGVQVQGSEKPFMLACSIDGRVLLYAHENEKPLACFTANMPNTTPSHAFPKHRGFAPVAAFDSGFDSHGMAIASDAQVIRLIDLRYYKKGEYLIISLKNTLKPSDWIRTLDFTPLTNNILVTTALGRIVLVSSIDGSIMREYKAPSWTGTDSLLRPRSSMPPGWESVGSLEFHTIGYGLPAVPADESVVAIGLWDHSAGFGRVVIWDFDNGNESTKIGQFLELPYFIKFHPTRAQLAIGDSMITSWVLDKDKS